MPRHDDQRALIPTIVTGAAALAAVGVIGYGVYELAAGGDSTPTTTVAQSSPTGSATAVPTTSAGVASSAPATPATSGAATSAVASPSTATAVSTATSTSTATSAAGGACAQVAAPLAAYTKATRAAAADWAMHVGAQSRYDAGQQSWAVTRKQWAASKAKGPADVQRYAAAKTRLDAALAACGDACAKSAVDVWAYEKAADAVVGQWKDHLVMMAGKESSDPNEYHQMWMKGVAEAQAPLAALAGLPDPTVACG